MDKRKYWSGSKIGKPSSAHSNVILVAPSNTQGRLGKGIAKVAKVHWGAVYGQSRGMSGRCYLLVTKNLKAGFTEPSTGITYPNAGGRSLTPQQIKSNIKDLYKCALENPHRYFVVPYTLNGINLNGFTGDEVWALFTEGVDVPPNIVFHESYKGMQLAYCERPPASPENH